MQFKKGIARLYENYQFYGSVPIFCKITNLKKLLDRKSPIGRIYLYTVHKNVTSNLQQISDTAVF